MRLWRAASLAALTFLALAGAARAETIELLPGGPDHWGARNIFAPFSSLFLGPGYWYGERTLEVRTTPPDAVVDLFYVRAGFQKRFEQADAPVTVLLPKRIDASPRDIVVVRAFAPGYRVEEERVKVSSRTDELLIELEPLPNVLESVAHTYFAGRAALTFYTKEPLSFRLQDRDDGFSVALNETAGSPELERALDEVRGPLVGKVVAHQLGEDLLVQVRWGPAADGHTEVRSRQGHDAIRNMHVYALDLIGPDAGAEGVAETKRALARIDRGDVTGCAARFDAALREALDPAALARALTPQGRFTDPYLRAAMRRLGEVSPGGTIHANGNAYRPDVPMHLAAAQNEAAQAEGYLALLRRLVELMEPPDQRRPVLRGLVAPELGAADFDAAMDAAEAAERACRAST